MRNLYFEELDSTNSWIKRNLEMIPKRGLLWVTAASQTGGRGQHGRTWISEKDQGLWTSFAYWRDPADQTILSLEIAARIAPLFAALGLKTTVKPPNDILVNGKKLCGILCETAWHKGEEAAIVGVGINVNSSPKSLDQPTTSLQEEGIAITCGELLDRLHAIINSADYSP